MPRPNPRQELLEAAVSHVSAHGLTDISLRGLARAIGTSHRMLIYHFGSKEELLVAIVEENEKAQRASISESADSGSQGPVDTLRSAWEQLADPSMWPAERLFFELYGQALQGRPGTTSLLDGIVTSWTEPAAQLLNERGIQFEDARAHARLSLAVFRGLLLDLLATKDSEGVELAMDAYARLLERSGMNS